MITFGCVNDTAMNINVQVLYKHMFFISLELIPGSGMGILLTTWRTAKSFTNVTASFTDEDANMWAVFPFI